jgi:hypothetical protein
MHFKVVDFAKDILDSALEMISPRCVMVFPTRAVADLARLRFEPRWRLEEILWLTMEDFKRVLLVQDEAILEDEKRLLCLWQVLSEEDKERFHLQEYNDLVEWGTNFFGFLQEFTEAGRHYDELLLLPDDPQLYIRAWQEDHIRHIHALLLRYKAFIAELGLSDRVFCLPLGNLQIPWQGYRIVLVNQFYFSRLEQELLSLCENSLNEVVLLNHEVSYLRDNWQMPLFEPEKSPMLEGLQERVKIYECENEEQAALAFLALNGPAPDAAIIDSSFWKQPYSALYPEDIVGNRQQLPITNTLLFRFLSLLKELAISQINSPGFIPLRVITRYCLDSEIPSCLLENWTEAQQELLTREIFALADSEVIMLDINPLEQFGNLPQDKSSYPLLCMLCQALFSKLSGILSLTGIRQLSELFAGELEPRRFCAKEELQKTDILEQFWTALANFMGTESLNIVADWSLIFSHPGIGIFGLWLDFLKPVLLRFNSPQSSKDSWEISNLLDSRNRSFANLAFLQVVEGILPQAPGSVWLLNEGQRARLGLLSYEVIRNWERYYFFRLVLTTPRVQIFTYRDLEMNQKPSSFIGELLQLAAVSCQKVRIPAKTLFEAYAGACENPLGAAIAQAECFHQKAGAEFCTLPAEPEKDFGGSHEIRFNSYDISLLERNPFVWYIQGLRKLKARKTDLQESLSPALFGTLMHSYFAEILGTNTSRHSNPASLKAAFTDDERLRVVLQSIAHSREFFYKIPRNYNEVFLNRIISDCLAASLKEFYYRFLEPYLQQSEFELIPEGARPDDERNYRQLCKVLFNQQEYPVKIKGRADLRINTPHTRYIIDFKTGSASVNQLIFYEWFYELIEHPERAKQMQSHFWMILDMQINRSEVVKDAKRASFAEDVAGNLQSCFADGYAIGRRSADRHMLKTISRSDLLVEREEK